MNGSFIGSITGSHFVSLLQSRTKAHQKYIWLLTYGASSSSITHEMIDEYDSIQTCKSKMLNVDECYTTHDRALKYTLLHLESKKRVTSIKKLMAFAYEKYGIVKQEIFGFKPISSNDVGYDLLEHPAIRVLLRHSSEERTSCSTWIKESKSKKGVLEMLRTKSLSADVSVEGSSDVVSLTICSCFFWDV